MKRCPRCRRFGILYDPDIERDVCIWRDCGWTNYECIDIDNFDFGETRFKKFRDSIGKGGEDV